MSNQYTKDSIESLDPREFVRLKPGVYAGDCTYSTQLIVELFSNALDEHNLGHGDTITVSYDKKTNICIVQDNGQGFLVNEMREDGKTVLEAAFSVLNTSGKYREDGVYEGTSLGAFGIGAKLPTYLSHWLEVITYRNGMYEKIRFEEGLFKERDTGFTKQANGTYIEFEPSEEFFVYTEPNITELKKLFNDICCLCPNLKVYLNGQMIQHNNGIEDMLSQKVDDDLEITNSRLIFTEKIDKQSLNLGLTYIDSSVSKIVPYVNYGLTDAGPHITTIKTIITRVLNNWAKENEILKKNDKNLDGASLQEGLILAFNLITPNVSYDAQVKSRITNTDFNNFITTVFSKQFEIWLDNNPTDATNIIERAIIARKATEAAKRERQRVKDKAAAKAEKVFKLPTKLTDCWSKDRSKCELLICEGKSAAGGLVEARDSEFQAVYGVRGKMLSVLKTTPEKILANQEINNIIQALGLECDNKTATLKYDKNKLRYDKIIACADADPDGKAIENLLFNILWYLCPDLILNGHVYSSEPPLFRITTKKNEYIYLRDADALKEYTEANKGKTYQISRNKGLGEQSAEELAYCLLDPKTRNVIQLTVSDTGMTDIMFNDLYGKKVEPRVEFLLEHSEEVEYDYE